MPSGNPVSPKVVWAGIGAAAAPIILVIITTVLGMLSSGQLVLPEPWQTVAFSVVSIAGAALGAYLKTDGLRLPTINPVALAKVPNGEQLLHNAAAQLPEAQSS